MDNNVWAIVLAAGKSTRMKQQKMLLPFNGKTIIETVILNILPVLGKNIMVVLGSHHLEIKNQMGKLPVKTCMNENYEEGMLSSVICGFRALPVDAEAVLVFLGDQPQIPGEVTRLVIKAWQNSDKGIVIPVTNGRRGHPVLIETKYKSEIEQLDPGKGLRQLMEKFAEDVEETECSLPEILRDIDTPEEYSREINLN
jgi:molybdenum cofactor cytidylyltransferase